tara:strand:+ start:119 stop:817 length:699 start_codon:yes stop_codon:yes gene_type:complete
MVLSMTGALSFLDRVRAQAGVKACFVSRIPEIRVSRDKWDTLEKLQPAHEVAVKALGFDWHNLWRAEQVHGDLVMQIPAEGVEGQIVEGADGLVTCGREGVLLGIYVADCAAVYICDCHTGALGLVHSGRRGTEQEIAVRALEKMRAAYGSDPRNLEVAISPCIRPPLYEVDFSSLIAEQLIKAGIPSGQIFSSGECTGARVDRYYSYRVERGKTGRMLALLGRRINNTEPV